MSDTVINEEETAAPGAPRPTALRRLGRAALDVVLPPLCIGCRTRITEHDALCPSCWRRIDFIRPPLCDRLGLPMPYDIGGPMLSAAAAAHPPEFDRARAVARFDGLMRELIHAFKFHDSHNARRLFGRWLTETGQEILVAVPLARWRLLTRRFNQAQILAGEVGRLAKKPVRPFALIRAKSTAHQIGLTRAQRSRNVASAFRVPAREMPVIAGKAIVLVDDVITSGATASAAASALKRGRRSARRCVGARDCFGSLFLTLEWRCRGAAQRRKFAQPGCMGRRTAYL